MISILLSICCVASCSSHFYNGLLSVPIYQLDLGSQNKENETAVLLSPHDLAQNQNTQTDSPMTEPLLSGNQGKIAITPPKLTPERDELLGQVLMSIIREELSECHLVVAYGASEEDSIALHIVLTLPNLRQLVLVKTLEDFSIMTSNSIKCRGYIFFFKDAQMLLKYLNGVSEPWDYHGRYIVVGFSKTELERIASSRKGTKTEHIIGVVKNKGESWDVYMNQLYTDQSIIPVKRWRQQGFTTDTRIFPDKTDDLKGNELKMVTFEFAPHVFREENEGPYYGRDVQIGETLSHALNFSLNIIDNPKDEFWGWKEEDGKWNGMSGVLEREEADFGIATMFLADSNNVSHVLDFSTFYSSEMTCFMTRSEPPLPRWQSLAAPFQMETWLALLIGLLLFCPILSIFARASIRSDEEQPHLKRLAYSNLYTLGIHLRQAQHQLPKREGTRMWVVFLWLYGIIITTGYSSNLTAFLTVERPRASIETIKELYSSNLEVMAVGYFFKLSLQGSENIYLKGLADRFRLLSTFDESYESMGRGKAVLVQSRSYLEYLIASKFVHRGVPSMRILKECYSPYSLVVPMQNHFPLKERFNRVLGLLFDSGILDQWFKETLRVSEKTEPSGAKDAEEDESERDDGFIPLSIDHVQGIFYIHFFGLALASLIFFSEVACSQRK